jgi:hypothetical protein
MPVGIENEKKGLPLVTLIENTFVRVYVGDAMPSNVVIVKKRKRE